MFESGAVEQVLGSMCSGLKRGGKQQKQLLVTVKSFIHMRGSSLPHTTDTA